MLATCINPKFNCDAKRAHAVCQGKHKETKIKVARLYKSDGTIKDIEPADKKNGFQLYELYDLIGCEMIQAVQFSEDEYFICDEEGLLKPHPVRNKNANEYITNAQGDNWDVHGNVVICKLKYFK